MSVLGVTVNNGIDFSFGFLSHNVLAPPPIPAPVPAPSVEMVATFLWTLGFVMNQNKFSNGAKPVTHKGLWVALDGHDSGMMIPDVTIPPAPNTWYPISWTFSSRKPMLAASTVKMNGTAVACAQWIAPIPIPMMTCGEPISAPVCWSAINVLNTLKVGVTWADIGAAVVNVIISVATDLLFNHLGNGANSPLGRTFARLGVAGDTVGRQFVQNLITNSLKGLSPVAILGGFIPSAMTGNPSTSIGIGLPFAGASVTITPSPDPGSSAIVGAASGGPFRGDTSGAGMVAGTPVTL